MLPDQLGIKWNSPSYGTTMPEPKPSPCHDSFNDSSLFHTFSACARELRSFLTRRLGCADAAADLVQDTTSG
jgi:hypothetical protein